MSITYKMGKQLSYAIDLRSCEPFNLPINSYERISVDGTSFLFMTEEHPLHLWFFLLLLIKFVRHNHFVLNEVRYRTRRRNRILLMLSSSSNKIANSFWASLRRWIIYLEFMFLEFSINSDIEPDFNDLLLCNFIKFWTLQITFILSWEKVRF